MENGGLPTEVWSQIIGLSRPEEAAALARCCRMFRELLKPGSVLWKSIYTSIFDPPGLAQTDDQPDRWYTALRERRKLSRRLRGILKGGKYQAIGAPDWDLSLQILQEARQRNYQHLDSTIRLIVNRYDFRDQTGYTSPNSINRLTMLYDQTGKGGNVDGERVRSWTPVEDSFDGSAIAWERVSIIAIYHLMDPVLTVAPWSDYPSDESWWSFVEGTWLGSLGTIFDTGFLHRKRGCQCAVFRITLERDLGRAHYSHLLEFVGHCTMVHRCRLEVFDTDLASYDFRAKVERHDKGNYLQWNGELQLDSGIIRLAGAQPIIGAVLVAGTRTRLPVEESVNIRAATWCFWPEGQACVKTQSGIK